MIVLLDCNSRSFLELEKLTSDILSDKIQILGLCLADFNTYKMFVT